MKSLLPISLLALLMLSCQDINRMEKPEDLIGQEKMVDVLTELSLLRGARNYNKNMLEETGIDPEEYLWDKYDIDSLQFVSSSDYYAQNYEQYEIIYDKVKARLESYKATYDSIRLEKERVEDSLRALKPEKAKLVKDSLRAQDSIRSRDSLLLKDSLLTRDSISLKDSILPRKIQLPMKGTETLPDTSGVIQLKRANTPKDSF